MNGVKKKDDDQHKVIEYRNHVRNISTPNDSSKDQFSECAGLPVHGQQHQQIGSSLGQSVVPDLMRVYESLTQSSTPQQPPQQESTSNSSDPSAQFHNHQIHNSSHNYNQKQQSQGQNQYQRNIQDEPNTLTSQPHYYQHHSQHHSQQHSQQQQHGHSHQFSHSQMQHENAVPQEFKHEYNGTRTPSQNFSNRNQQNDNRGTQHSYVPTNSHGINGVTHTDTLGNSKTATRKRQIDNEDNRSVNSGSSLGAVSSTKSRKKGAGDSRWSKRFTWPDALHRDFVSAIFDVGLKHASPSAILENMTPNEQITSERIKSHLQKYRLHRPKSKREFIESYDLALARLKRNDAVGSHTNQNAGDQNKKLSLGEVAAHLSFTSMSLDISGIGFPPNSDLTGEVPSSHIHGIPTIPHQGGLRLPQLSDEEKRSPLGASMGYLLGLFVSLTQQISLQRSMKKEAMAENANETYKNTQVPSINQEANQYNRNQMQHHQDMNYNRTQIHHSSSQTNLHRNSSNVHSDPPKNWNPPPSNVTLSHPSKHPGPQRDSVVSHQQQQTPPWSVGVKVNNSIKDSSEITPSIRSFPNMEESNKMKREMQNQMALQKSFRAFKQQELSKCTNQLPLPHSDRPQIQGQTSTLRNSEQDQNSKELNTQDGSKIGLTSSQSSNAGQATHSEGGTDHRIQNSTENTTEGSNAKKAGTMWENAGHGVDDFWNVDMVDDQLFEFLMTE